MDELYSNYKNGNIFDVVASKQHPTPSESDPHPLVIFRTATTMQLTSFLILTCISLAAALPDFAMAPTKLVTIQNADVPKFTKAWNDAAKSYQAIKTAAPEWSSMYSALVEYQKTGKDVPEIATATDRITTYDTTPEWYVHIYMVN
jgi:hypothetical protein